MSSASVAPGRSAATPAGLGLRSLCLGALWLGVVGCEAGAITPDTPDAQGSAPSVQAGAAPEVAARLKGDPISLEEVDAQVMKAEMEVIQQLYDARRRAINKLVEDRLVAAEAEKRGVTSDALIAAEITDKVDDISDEDIESFYDENKAAIGDQALESLRPRIRTFLAQRGIGERRRAFYDGLKRDAGFEIFLEPPRRSMEVADDEPGRGSVGAPVTIVEYSDFQCPFCSRVLPTLTSIFDKYGEKVRLVYRDYPLAIHPDAQLAAEAAQCAHGQDKFWDYHNLLFANQGDLKPEALKRYADDLDLDAKQFGTCLDGRQHLASVTMETEQGSSLGVTGTPAFFINGRFLSGAVPLENFEEIIDDELARLGESRS